jgi:4-diphosphocytidyl-2-C-methyl-D-erythritol kinase
VPGGEQNLARRAAAAITELSGMSWRIEIDLVKRIPVGAGLGGGSSDAATVLAAAADEMEAAGHPINPEAVSDAAAQLGSDVPVLLRPGTYRMRGRGEQLDCLPSLPLHLVVVPLTTNPTGDVYAAVTSPSAEGRVARVADALLGGGLPSVTDFGSALEKPAAVAVPEFGRALEGLRHSTAPHAWHVTGSGGAAYHVAPDRVAAELLAKQVQSAALSPIVCRAIA